MAWGAYIKAKAEAVKEAYEKKVGAEKDAYMKTQDAYKQVYQAEVGAVPTEAPKASLVQLTDASARWNPAKIAWITDVYTNVSTEAAQAYNFTRDAMREAYADAIGAAPTTAPASK